MESLVGRDVISTIPGGQSAEDLMVRSTRGSVSALALRRSGLIIVIVALVLTAPPRPSDPGAQQVCEPPDDRAVLDALARMRRAVDPCGESDQIRAVLERLDRCAKGGYQICSSTAAARNVFDRPVDGGLPLGTITWNPELRTELADALDGSPETAVRRDPTASLLHELVHVAQECGGLNPGEHELEAVRIENIYRRASGLAQRTGYGEQRLPDEMVRFCSSVSCPCSAPTWVRGADRPTTFATKLDRSGPHRTGDLPASRTE